MGAKDRIIVPLDYRRDCLVTHLYRKCSRERADCLAASRPAVLNIAVFDIAAAVGSVDECNCNYKHLVK